MKTPESIPPGEKYRLRLTVRDETTDALIANLSTPEIRRTLPGFLYVFSEQHYIHNPDDYIDGRSDKELEFGSFQRKLNDYDRVTFGAEAQFQVTSRFLRLGVHLGYQAASRILVSPMFENLDSDVVVLPVYYGLPGMNHPASALPSRQAVNDLRDHLQTRPANTFDELVLVNVNTPDALRPRSIRTRERRDDILAS